MIYHTGIVFAGFALGIAVAFLVEFITDRNYLRDKLHAKTQEVLGLHAQLVKAKSSAVDPDMLEMMRADRRLLAAARFLMVDPDELTDGERVRWNKALALLWGDADEAG